ncbi:hypothetical protein GQ457_11G004910 [Hibiscus cannabinus]
MSWPGALELPDVRAVNEPNEHERGFSSIQPSCFILKPCCWSAPNKNSLKFNTDGVSVGIIDALTIKILALKEAIRLFNNSEWCNRFKVVFECDSELVVGWMLRPHSTPTSLKDNIVSCLSNNKALNATFSSCLGSAIW